MKVKKITLLLIISLFAAAVTAQDLDSLLDSQMKTSIDYTTATFKSTRIMNGHSIERMPAGQLDFRICHRFGRLNSGAYNLWGLDEANMHFSFEYGITNWVMAGIGRGTYEKAFDGFLKFSLLRQSSGAINMPVSVSYFTSMYVNTLKWIYPERTNYFSSRLSYVHQILVARKFSENLSLQVSPTFIHRNLVASELDPNDLYSIGVGGRIKLSHRVSLNAEYYYVIHPPRYSPTIKTYNPLAIGVDIETGGHVFQLMFTNSLAMTEKGFIGETTGSWLKRDIHFGFNLSRVFMLK